MTPQVGWSITLAAVFPATRSRKAPADYPGANRAGNMGLTPSGVPFQTVCMGLRRHAPGGMKWPNKINGRYVTGFTSRAAIMSITVLPGLRSITPADSGCSDGTGQTVNGSSEGRGSSADGSGSHGFSRAITPREWAHSIQCLGFGYDNRSMSS